MRARPPSRAYLTKKFVRRHRTLVAGTGATLLALALGLAGTILQSRRLETARNDAIAQAERARAARDFLDEILSSADPNVHARHAGTTVSPIATAPTAAACW